MIISLPLSKIDTSGRPPHLLIFTTRFWIPGSDFTTYFTTFYHFLPLFYHFLPLFYHYFTTFLPLTEYFLPPASASPSEVRVRAHRPDEFYGVRGSRSGKFWEW